MSTALPREARRRAVIIMLLLRLAAIPYRRRPEFATLTPFDELNLMSIYGVPKALILPSLIIPRYNGQFKMNIIFYEI